MLDRPKEVHWQYDPAVNASEREVPIAREKEWLRPTNPVPDLWRLRAMAAFFSIGSGLFLAGGVLASLKLGLSATASLKRTFQEVTARDAVAGPGWAIWSMVTTDRLTSDRLDV